LKKAQSILKDDTLENFALGQYDMSPVLRVPPILYGREKELAYLLDTSEGMLIMLCLTHY